ncbi:MAG: dihydrofolate reductase family protein [Methanoregulaceae archaeon]|nr:dihydrofolate reductase family protein [Methanoregulaceae archaeon]
MIPEVIIHNSVSLDGSLTGFEPDLELHYSIARDYRPDMHLIGSNTVRAGIAMFGGEVPPEGETDFQRPDRDQTLPAWVIMDTRGSLQGLLHHCRRFEYCRDVVVLVSEKTPAAYLEHLKERKYDYLVAGNDHADLRRALELLSDTFHAKRVLTDTGRILGNLLLGQGLVSEISLLVHPVVVGENGRYGMFENVEKDIHLELIRHEVLKDRFVRLAYKPAKG